MDVPRRKTPHIFTCLQCGKTVETYPSRARQQFCSRECFKAHAQQEATITKTCLGCGKSYTSIKARDYKLYCSQQCYFEHRDKSCPIVKGWQNCAICGKKFKNYSKRVKCCSSECRKVLIAQKPRKPEHLKTGHRRKYDTPRQPLPRFVTRACVICEKEFQTRRRADGNSITKTCSRPCQQALIWEKRGAAPKATKNCAHCGNEFTISTVMTRTIYCSNACRMANMQKGRIADPANTIIKQCLECGQTMPVMKCVVNRKKFCSRSCKAMYYIRVRSTQYPTSIETKLYQALDLLKVKYIPQYGMGRYVPDAWLPDYSTIIEADGVYWHSLPKNAERDRKLAAYAKRMGYPLIRLDEMFIKSIDVHELAQHIKRQLS